MPPTLSPDRRSRAGVDHLREHTCTPGRERRLAGYSVGRGARREIVEMPGARGTRLVVDRDAHTRDDGRLVAHLAADEPAGNSEVVCCHYLRSDRGALPAGRRVAEADMRAAPFAELHDHLSPAPGGPIAPAVAGYRIEPVAGSRMHVPELRWRRIGRDPATVSLREVVGDLEDYEPVCGLTAQGLRTHGGEPVSTSVLGVELGRVQRSAIVLNRRLRETVLAALARNELSMSEIAMRCGRVKRDARGCASGETSWLARRLGLLAEGGQPRPTPWIHSDVLGLIARRGLGISPREVEL